ncbi:hypothetical protein HK102_002359, partial [Quaeritorhiza haematococci]
MGSDAQSTATKPLSQMTPSPTSPSAPSTSGRSITSVHTPKTGQPSDPPSGKRASMSPVQSGSPTSPSFVASSPAAPATEPLKGGTRTVAPTSTPNEIQRQKASLTEPGSHTYTSQPNPSRSFLPESETGLSRSIPSTVPDTPATTILLPRTQLKPNPVITSASQAPTTSPSSTSPSRQPPTSFLNSTSSSPASSTTPTPTG